MRQHILKLCLQSLFAVACFLPSFAHSMAFGPSMGMLLDEATEWAGNPVAESAPAGDSSAVSGVGVAGTGELAGKLAGTYVAVHGGESYNNDFFELLPVQKEYFVAVEVKGDQIVLRNFGDAGNECSLCGKLVDDVRRIDFNTQGIYMGWDAFLLSGETEATFSAAVSDDFTTLAFDSFRLLFRGDGFETVSSLTLTKLPEPVAEWSVAGTTKWVTEEGKYSANLQKNTHVTLTKFVQGTEAYYELSNLGYDDADPIPVKLSVNADGTLKFVNACDGAYYDNVKKLGDSVALYPYGVQGVPESGTEGDILGGEFHAPYYYYDSRADYDVTERGVFHILWGTYDVPELEFATNPANGSEVDGIGNIVYTFYEAEVAGLNENGQNVSIVDEYGVPVGSHVSLSQATEQNQIAVTCNEILYPGTYTITIGKGSVVLDGKVWEQDIVIHLTVKAKWQGEVVLPEGVATVEDLLNVPMVFSFAEKVEVSNFGVLGAVYDTDGSVYALLLTDDFAGLVGNVDIDGENVTAHFARMSDLMATFGSGAESIAKSVAGFVQPGVGVATLYVCPKSFVVDGVIFDSGILKTYEVFGSGQITGIDGSSANHAVGTCHDLQGRRVTVPRKGVFIQNGKKIVR